MGQTTTTIPAAMWMPTRPYGVVDAINRVAAATGSMRYAQLAASADYNGHAVRGWFNDYRRYWLAEYHWGERVVLARGDLVGVVRAGVREHARGALGATFVVSIVDRADAGLTPAEQATVCADAGMVPWSPAIEAAHDASWRTPLHAEVTGAFQYERNGLAPAIGLLANATSIEDYRAQLAAYIAERRAARTGGMR